MTCWAENYVKRIAQGLLDYSKKVQICLSYHSTGKSCNMETDNESCVHITKLNYLRKILTNRNFIYIDIQAALTLWNIW